MCKQMKKKMPLASGDPALEKLKCKLDFSLIPRGRILCVVAVQLDLESLVVTALLFILIIFSPSWLFFSESMASDQWNILIIGRI